MIIHYHNLIFIYSIMSNTDKLVTYTKENNAICAKYDDFVSNDISPRWFWATEMEALKHLNENSLSISNEDKDKIRAVFSGGIEEVVIPYISVSHIDDFLSKEFNRDERIENWSKTNWWDLDWWFYFPIWNEDETERKIICVEGSAWNSSFLTIYRSDEENNDLY